MQKEPALKNPYLFVVGCPRSGTTLLQRMLDHHPMLTVANDTHFITRAAKKALSRHANPALTSELVEAVIHYRRTRRLGLDPQTIAEAANGCLTYADFVSQLYELRGQQQQKPLSGEKTPDYCRQMPALNGLFPTARFIHIIRDGRSTALSTLEWAQEDKGPGKWALWSTDPVGTCALWWRWQVGCGQRDGLKLGSNLYLSIRYEDLVADPTATLTSITDFLDLSYSDEMQKFHVGKTRSAPGLSAKSAWLPATQGLRDWQHDMSAEDLSVFSLIAGDLLRECGYPCEQPSASADAQKRARYCLDWWDAQDKK